MPSARGTLVIVEDSRADQQLYRLSLRSVAPDLDVKFISDGAEAVRYLASDEWVDRTRLVLLDLNLPSVAGLDILDRVASGQLPRIAPIVVVSGSSAAVDIRRAYELGAAGYAVKPDSVSELREMLALLRDTWFHCFETPVN